MSGSQRRRDGGWTQPEYSNYGIENHYNQVLVFNLPREKSELQSYILQFLGAKYSQRSSASYCQLNEEGDGSKVANIVSRLTMSVNYSENLYVKTVNLKCSKTTKKKVILYGSTSNDLTKVCDTSGNFYESVQNFKRQNGAQNPEVLSRLNFGGQMLSVSRDPVEQAIGNGLVLATGVATLHNKYVEEESIAPTNREAATAWVDIAQSACKLVSSFDDLMRRDGEDKSDLGEAASKLGDTILHNRETFITGLEELSTQIANLFCEDKWN